MNKIQEKIWFAEYKVLKSRAKPGKTIRRMWPDATDAQVQDLCGYFCGDFDVEITSDKNVWIDAYQCIRSCMQNKGELCERAYSPHGVQIAVMRDKSGGIVARMLVRDGKANAAYGSQAHTLIAALTMLGGVTLCSAWLDDVYHDEIAVTGEVVWAELCVDVWETIPTYHSYPAHWCMPGYATYSHKRVGTKSLSVKRQGVVFRPYLDTH